MATNNTPILDGPMTPDLVARLRAWARDERLGDGTLLLQAADALAALPPPADPPALVALVARIQNAEAESEQAALRGDMAASATATERGDAAYDDLLAYPLHAAPPQEDQ